jgi:hypothetical protein
MPKATLTFNLPAEADDFEVAKDGWKYKSQIEDIWNHVFRPYRKHGYNNQELNKVIEDNPEVADKIIESLIEIYHQVLRDE